MKHEYIIALDISSIDTGITILEVDTKKYNTYSIPRKNMLKFQKILDKNFDGNDFQRMYDIFNIEENIGGILRVAFKEYYDLEREAKNKNEKITPLIVHIVPEKPFVPFTQEQSKFRKASNVTSIYYGIYLATILQYTNILTNNSFSPILEPVTAMAWKRYFKVTSDKSTSIKLANSMGLETNNDNMAESFLIAHWYLENKLATNQKKLVDSYNEFSEWVTKQESKGK